MGNILHVKRSPLCNIKPSAAIAMEASVTSFPSLNLKFLLHFFVHSTVTKLHLQKEMSNSMQGQKNVHT